MTPGIGRDLDAVLGAHAPRRACRAFLRAIAERGRSRSPISSAAAASPGALDAAVGPAHDGIAQKALDVFADEAFVNGLKGAGVRGDRFRRARRARRARRRRTLAGRDRSARRLQQHRRQRLDRHVVLGARRARRESSGPRLSCSEASGSARRASFSTARIPTSCSRPAQACTWRRSTRTQTRSG